MPKNTQYARADHWSVSIRYDGRDAKDHKIDLHQLGLSLQGMARVLAVSAHFMETGRYNKQFDTLSVKVIAQPVHEHRCYEVAATIYRVATSGEVWSGLGTAAFMSILGYIFNRKKAEEMKHLSEALQQSIGQQAQMQERMLVTIEKLAESLQPAVRQALNPIGQSVDAISLSSPNCLTDGTVASTASFVLDRQSKELAQTQKHHSITGPHQMNGVISELDMLTGSCKVSLHNDAQTLDPTHCDGGTRLNAKIVDPVVGLPNNPYAIALSAASSITFTAKAAIDAEGNVTLLYISDCQANAFTDAHG